MVRVRGAVSPILAVMLAAAAVRLATLGRPFAFDDEGTACGPLLCVARNYVRYGLAASGLGGVMNTGLVPPDAWAIYAHHPPLVPLLIGGLQRLAGVSEWTARAVPALFSLASTAVLYVMAVRRFGPRVAAAAALLYAFSPLTLLFGGMPEYVGSQLVFFGLLTIECYLRWTELRRVGWLVAAGMAFLLGALTDWPMFYLVPLLGAHRLLTGSRRALPAIVPFLAAAALLFLAIVLWAETVSAGREYSSAVGGSFSVLRQFSFRAIGRPGDPGTPATLGIWLRRVIVERGVLHGWPLLALAAVYLVRAARHLASRDWMAVRTDEAPLLVLFWGAVHLAVGIEGTFQHPWWSVLVTPGLAFTAALGFVRALDAAAGGARLRISVTVLLALAFVLSSAGLVCWVSDQCRSRDQEGYTPRELGTTIQTVARAEEGVLTSAMSPDPALWFYADRQIRPDVRSLEELEHALAPGPYALYYGYVQPSGPAPRWFVMPDPHRRLLQPLTAALDARFPRHVVNGFSVYHLE